MKKVTTANGRTAYEHNGRLLTPDAAKLVRKNEKQAAKNTDRCRACGSDNLFDGYFGARGADGRTLAQMLHQDAKHKGTFRTVCNDCSTFQ
jgi:hypothetical protein